MSKLVLPEIQYVDSFLKASSEFKSAGLFEYVEAEPGSPFNWSKFLKKELNQRIGRNLGPGLVPSTSFWLIDQGEYIGTGNIRHLLNPNLENFGGHIGYYIRPSLWQKGYGSEILPLLLQKAAEMDIKSALITCDSTNYPSAKIIEKNGGILIDQVDRYEDEKAGKTNRYLVDTGLGIKNYIVTAFRPKVKDIKYIYGKEIDLELEGLYGKDINSVVNYVFYMREKGTRNKVGRISLRLGCNDFTYYSGNIGYNVEEQFRSNHFAGKASLMIKELLMQYKIKDRIFLTVNPDNIPSRKTCEYMGCKFLELVKLPEDNEMYQIGERYKCRYYFDI